MFNDVFLSVILMHLFTNKNRFIRSEGVIVVREALSPGTGGGGLPPYNGLYRASPESVVSGFTKKG